MEESRAIYGVDFSGAQDAGDKIWIAKGIPDGWRLMASECYRAKDLPNSGKLIEGCLPALVKLISSSQGAVFGFDFPFGLPAPLVHDKTWEDFVLGFPIRSKPLRRSKRRVSKPVEVAAGSHDGVESERKISSYPVGDAKNPLVSLK
jgi:hypothetical protein